MKPQPVSASWPKMLTSHRGWLSAVIFARVRDHDAVEEVLQETALAASVAAQRGIGPTDDTGQKRWLYRVALRQSMLYRRNQGRNKHKNNGYAIHLSQVATATGSEASHKTEQDRNNPLAILLATEKSDLVQRAMQRLSNADCEILFLKYTENWSCGDMASRLGVSLSAVKSRLLRARGNLRRELLSMNHSWEEQ